MVAMQILNKKGEKRNMSELKTIKSRIILRNDSTANWLSDEVQTLLKGEVGIEFLADGKVKMKIGDGVTTWANLPYFGEEDDAALKAELQAEIDADVKALADGQVTTNKNDIDSLLTQITWGEF
jgi:hypothetical protein